MSIGADNQPSVLHKILAAGRGRVHISGILGVSTSALAELLADRGIFVSGSDDDRSRSFSRLKALGVRISQAGDRGIIGAADALVFSSAVSPSHPDRLAARELGVPEYSRAELLGALMLLYKRRIGVSGTHGKSTTTAMLGRIFSAASLLPTVLCGARIDAGGCLLRGGSEYLIYEACEYRDSFLHFSPTCAIITNIELDHTDYFSSLSQLEESFSASVADAECAVISVDYPAARRVASILGKRALTISALDGAEYRYLVLSRTPGGAEVALLHREKELLSFRISVGGEYNIANAAIAALAALSQGVSPSAIVEGLGEFRGIEKRMERLGSLGGTEIYRDYAHHPGEIRAALGSIKALCGSVGVVFRPHTYTRTRDLWGGFVKELSSADELAICDIYPAREDPIDGVSAQALARDIKGAVAIPTDEAVRFIRSFSSRAVILMGAGDLDSAEREISALIKGEIK